MLGLIVQLFREMQVISNRIINFAVGFVPDDLRSFLWKFIGTVKTAIDWVIENFGNSLESVFQLIAKISMKIIDFIMEIIKGVLG